MSLIKIIRKLWVGDKVKIIEDHPPVSKKCLSIFCNKEIETGAYCSHECLSEQVQYQINVTTGNIDY